MITFSAIVAYSQNRVIGRDNDLPWRLADDLKFFKAKTLGKTLLMGRKTYESIGRPLPGRQTVVLSRQPGLQIEGCEVISSLGQLKQLPLMSQEVMVAGGEAIFKLCLPHCHFVYATEVLAEVEGDTFFPTLDNDVWQRSEVSHHPKDERHEYAFEFVTYKRKS